ncbi:hypothetical protein CL634_04455 [bacterium]|nr:hypothetical protein [bacterium]|tara:strand:- start:70 stop:447 length:378 start_codon:yes stop_codon:yes gene_type:complete
MQKSVKYIYGSLLLLTTPGLALAQNGKISEAMIKGIEESKIALGTTSVDVAVGGILRTFLVLLGVVFLATTFYGGWVWMTAWGNEERVQKGKDIVRAGFLGLFVVAASYSISILLTQNFSAGFIQ